MSMRVITYILLTLSCLFALNVFVAATSPSYKTFLQEVKGNLSPGSAAHVIREKRLTAADMQSDKLAKALDHLADKVGSLEVKAPPVIQTGAVTIPPETLTGTTGTGVTATGVTASGSVPERPTLTLPGSLLARLMPQFIPTKIENAGVFGVKKFDVMPYVTYYDKKKKLKVYVFDRKYDFLKAYFKMSENIFTIKETNSFFQHTFFLNPVKKETTIRFITIIENKTIGFEMPKKVYPIAKKLLTK